MAETIGKFDYTIIAPKEGDELYVPMNATVNIVLKSWSHRENSSQPVLSCDLMSDAEIGEYIDALKKDLDYIGERAKSHLRRANSTTRLHVERLHSQNIVQREIDEGEVD